MNTEHPVLVAQRIQERVAALGVTCSIGVGTSKSVAKIASDRDKPRGLTVVFPGTEAAFLEKLPVRTLSGVGAAAERTLLPTACAPWEPWAGPTAPFCGRSSGRTAR